jgi:hypothetical protein
VKFGQRWLNDPSVGPLDFLNFELYPWHSLTFTRNGFRPNVELTRDLVFAPIAEVDVDFAFAFGAPWFEIAQKLDLPLLRLFTSTELRTDLPGHSGWKVALFDLGDRRLLVSSQLGSANPPGEHRLAHLRNLLEAEV